MKKVLLLSISFVLISLSIFSQTDNFSSKKMGFPFSSKHIRFVKKMNFNKSVEVVKPRLDSVIGDYYKEYYYYDDQYRVIQYITYLFDQEEDIWKGYFKNIFTYGTHNTPTEMLYYLWDEVSNNWKHSYKEINSYYGDGKIKDHESYSYEENEWQGGNKFEREYDIEGNISSEITYIWTMPGDWGKNQKYDYEYNSEGNKTLEIRHSYSSQNDIWIISQKGEYIYDSQYNLIIKFYYRLDENEDWKYSSKYEIDYDQYNKVTFSTIYLWSDTAGENWREVYKDKYENEYDNNGNMTSQITSRWTPDFGWEFDKKYEYAYDSQNKTTLYLRAKWNQNENNWIYEFKRESSYDNQGNTRESADYYWNAQLNDWIGRTKKIFTFDYSYTISQIIFPSIGGEDDIPFLNKPEDITEYIWNNNENNWETYDLNIYHYSEQNTSGIGKNEKYKIEFYPNPVSDNITFMIPDDIKNVSFKLYDMQGKELISKEIKGNNSSINVNQLPSGAYFYKLIMDSGIKTGKIVKK